MKATNSKNLTALGILQGQNQEDSGKCKQILLSAYRAIFVGAIALIQRISQLKYNIKTMSGDKNNALLVVTVLILAATCQASDKQVNNIYLHLKKKILKKIQRIES